MNAHLSNAKTTRGFTIVELLVSTVILALLMVACMSAVDSVRRSVTGVRSKTQQFREARLAFELITRTLSQATLNTYWDYYYKDTESNQAPTGVVAPPSAYIRHSELQFQVGKSTQLLGATTTQATYPGHAIFFQAPLGLTLDQNGLGSLLNARGFAIQFGDDSANRPPLLADYKIPVRHRYRLVEYRPPAEKSVSFQGSTKVSFQGNTIYSHPDDWFRQDLNASTRVVSDNIILLLFSSRISDEAARSTNLPASWIAPAYTYNSLDVNNATLEVDKVSVNASGNALQGTQHLLPPLVTVTMVALDENSGARWAEEYGETAVDFLAEAEAPFTNVTAYEADLSKLESYLNDKHLNYEVFSHTIPLRNARWDSRTF